MATRLSSKGQITIPREIRYRKGWRAGTRLIIEDRGSCVVLRPAAPSPTSDLDDLVGCAGYEGPARSLAEMDAAIAQAAGRRR